LNETLKLKNEELKNCVNVLRTKVIKLEKERIVLNKKMTDLAVAVL
jgi:hypothetical protein